MKKVLPVLLLLCIAIKNDISAQDPNKRKFTAADSVMAIKIAQNTINYSTEILKHKDQLKDKSKLPGFYANRAAAEAMLNQNAKALSDYSAAIALKPDLIDAILARGMLYARLKQFQPAVNDFRRLVVLLPGQNDKLIVLYNTIAEGERNLQHYDKAIEASTAAIAINPQIADAYKSRAISYSLMGKYDLAIDDINLVIYGTAPKENRITDPASFIAMAATRSDADRHALSELIEMRADVQRIKHPRDAINDYSLAIKLWPENKIAYWDRAAAYRGNGDYQLATDDYSRAITFYKGDKYALARLYEDRAQMEMGLYQFKKVIADDSLAVSADPTYVVAYWTMADAQAQNGDLEQSNATYKKVLPFYKGANKQLASMYLNMANNNFILKNYEQAIADCNAAITNNPAAWGPYLYRGRAYLKLSKKELGMADIRKLMAMDTTKQSLDYAFALFYAGEGDKGVAILQKAIIGTNDAYVLSTYYYDMACLLSLMSKPDEANVYLKKCIDGGYPKRFAQLDSDLDNIRDTAEFKGMMAAN